MRTLYLDCFSGISGDMTVAVLRDLGVEEDVFQTAIAQLDLPERCIFSFLEACARALPDGSSRFTLTPETLSTRMVAVFGEIRRLIENSQLSDFVRTRSIAVFQRIATAEGKIHGIPVEDVGFHEVGALDSIADIVSACAGIEALRVDSIIASPLVDGSGTVNCSHGRFRCPLPRLWKFSWAFLSNSSTSLTS